MKRGEPMSPSPKRLRIHYALAFALILLVGYFVTSPQWVDFLGVPYCSGLRQEAVTEITLKKTGDSAKGVAFTDTDLIQEWMDCLAHLEVKRERSFPFFRSTVVGGKPFVCLKTESANYSFLLLTAEGFKIKIEGKTYLIKNPEGIPFDETYEKAMLRHGTVSFDKRQR